MSGFDTLKVITVGVAVVIGAGVPGKAQSADTSPYVPPEKSIKLSTAAAATLARARTAALVALDTSRLEVVSFNANTKETVIVRRGGIRRAVSADKAREELADGIRKWNRFTIVDDPLRADIVIVVFEDTVEPSAFTKVTGDRKHRLRERLAVYPPDRPTEPLWANEVRESTVNALTGSPVGKVVDKFREDLEKATTAERQASRLPSSNPWDLETLRGR